MKARCCECSLLRDVNCLHRCAECTNQMCVAAFAPFMTPTAIREVRIDGVLHIGIAPGVWGVDAFEQLRLAYESTSYELEA